MEWLTLVSTVVGAILGVGATTLNERVKWKRERWKAQHEARTKLYGDYLSDLTKTRDAIRSVSRTEWKDDASRRKAADDAFLSANIYARRYQIRITAPKDVADQAAKTLRELRQMRELVGAGEKHHSDAYLAWKDVYDPILIELMDLMEKDLDEIR